MSPGRSPTSQTRSKSTRSRMAIPRSMNSKSTKRTSAKSSAARAASSADSAPSSKPPPPAKALASTSTSSNAPPDFLIVAQVLGAHGIRGELKCRIVTDFPSRRFRRGQAVVIEGVSRTIQAARVQGLTVLLKLEDVLDRDAALTLRGKEVQIRVEDAV